MGLPETEREISVCKLVAEAINLSEGTDYRAHACKLDPPDAMLVSVSGRYATRQAEVVSTPQDFTIRPDNKNVRRSERELSSALEQLGVSHCQVTVNWTEFAKRYGTENRHSKRLAEIIAQEIPANGYLCIGGNELYDYSPQLSEIVNYVSMYRFDFLTLAVHSTCSCWIPRDGRWIEDALEKKLQRYGSRAASGMILVIDGFWHLDGEQMDAFRASKGAEKILFGEVWAVSMGKAHRLKP
jgi:hypothetical protein